jgi:putative nucleotidyltransferase with HDIG domain
MQMDVLTAEQTARPHIAIAAGNVAQRRQLGNGLMSFYQFAEYDDISHAVAGCRTRPPLLVLVSEDLPRHGGFDFVRMVRLDPNLAPIPVVMLVATDDQPTRNRAAQCGADAFLAVPFSRTALISAVSGQLNRGVERAWKALPPMQRQALTDTLHLFNGISDVISKGSPIPFQTVSDACASLVEVVSNDDYRGVLQGVRSHDNYSYAHSMRVATYLALFGFNLRLSKQEQLILASGGLLHDVGKMSIPHEILNKPGRLTEVEMLVMRGHVPASLAYLRHCHDLPKGVITIAAQHHEKLDGTGYPLGLAGGQLNRLARIASIVDVFSALTDRRAYKPAMEAETALQFMVEEMTSHLDVKLLGLFRQMLLDATPEPARPELARPNLAHL